jgi:hypothetical protein
MEIYAMSKGSGRRPGEGYEDGWSRIFGNKDAERKKNQDLRKRLDAMPVEKLHQITEPCSMKSVCKCAHPFCSCEEGKCLMEDV